MLLLVALLVLSGCQLSSSSASYAAINDGGFSVAQVPIDRVPARYRRQTVAYASPYAPGTIVIDPSKNFLYLIEPGGRALRYGVSTGDGAFSWAGSAQIGRKAHWPSWSPTPEMIARSAGTGTKPKGRAPGALNPLGARALYLFQDGRDTLYRVHGTSEWWSIGRTASLGCIRLLNQDVIDLFDRVPLHATVIVLPR
ncbi:hypothetical protein Sa4125_09240 [Aureimonas sp. SA4125]|uniref:L,D-transpeptidase n=1 Tax=Aureimonas sp. SA4125 TaxID=2826993 RepID=UPI001CC47929|nr:L,D-transpeptidase [Aureimonas sp. SA4125]BDA83382.1 hypothetical protein Sa4125_09240 [Aureimonas sp. SA4125]